MKIKFIQIVAVVAIITLVHIVATTFELYEKTVWVIDGPSHLLGGVALGMLWIYIAEKVLGHETITTQHNLPMVGSIIGFALLGSLAW